MKKIIKYLLSFSIMLSSVVSVGTSAAAADDVLRESDFETDDTEFGWVKPGQIFSSYMLGKDSKSEMSILDENGNRVLQVRTLKNTIGSVSIPFDASSNPVKRNSFIAELEITPMDANSCITFLSISGDKQVSSPIFMLDKNGLVYARTGSTGHPDMVYRRKWTQGNTYSIKLVFNLSSKSYDLYFGESGGTLLKIIGRGALEDCYEEAFSKGISGFMLRTGEGPHEESIMRIDNIRVIGSDTAGKAPSVPEYAGEIRPEVQKAAEPVSYYVSPTGSDKNPGTSPDKPFASVSKAASLLCSIDTDNYSGYKNRITRNTVYDNETYVKWISIQNLSDGNGIIIDSNKNESAELKSFGICAYGGRTLVANNISYENGGSGIHNYMSAHTDIINNTVYNNHRCSAINSAQLYDNRGTDVNIVNNLVYGRDGEKENINEKINSNSKDIVYDYNIYCNGNVQSSGEHDLYVDDVKLADIKNHDFMPLASSPAIGYATSAWLSVVGSDIYGKSRIQGAVTCGAIEP